jgi:hypothetical protein
MSDYDVKVRIDLDQAQADWDKIVNMSKAASKQIKTAVKSVDDDTKKAPGAEKASQSIEQLSDRVDKLVGKMQKLSAVKKMDGVENERAIRKSNELKKELTKLGGESAGARHKLDQLNAATKTFTTTTRRAAEATGTWWKRFGAVAVGFGVAYRAINVLENGIASYISILKEGIVAQDDFIQLQGKLAIYSQLYASNAKDFTEGFKIAAVNVDAFQRQLPGALSAVNELTEGVDEFVQHGMAIAPMTAKSMVNFLDFTAMVATTTGSTAKQIRQEIQSLFEGTQKAGNTVLRLLKSLLPEFEEFKKRIREGDTEKAMTEVMERISKQMERYKELMAGSSMQYAHTLWRKTLVLDIKEAASMAAQMKGLGDSTNIFAAVFAKNAREMSYASKEVLAKAFIDLAGALDGLLKHSTEIIVFLTQATRSITGLMNILANYGDVILFSAAIWGLSKALRAFAASALLASSPRALAFVAALAGPKGLIAAFAAGSGLILNKFTKTITDITYEAGKATEILSDMLNELPMEFTAYVEEMEAGGKTHKEILDQLIKNQKSYGENADIIARKLEEHGVRYKELTVLGRAWNAVFGESTDISEEYADAMTKVQAEHEKYLKIFKEAREDEEGRKEALKTLKQTHLKFFDDLKKAAKEGKESVVGSLTELAFDELALKIKETNKELKELQTLLSTKPNDERLRLAMEQLKHEITGLEFDQENVVTGVYSTLAALVKLGEGFDTELTNVKEAAIRLGVDYSAAVEALCNQFLEELRTLEEESAGLFASPAIEKAFKKFLKKLVSTKDSVTDTLAEIKKKFTLTFSPRTFGNEWADRINNALAVMHDMIKETDQYKDKLKEIHEYEKAGLIEQAKLRKDILDASYLYLDTQISHLRGFFGVMSQLFEENSKERKDLHKLEMAFGAIELTMYAKKMAADIVLTTTMLANSAKRIAQKGVEIVIDAVKGIVNQASGDPYTAFFRMAAMASVMAGLLAIIGKQLGFGGGSSDNRSGELTDTTGTVLGDTSKSSESVKNSLALMKEYHADDYNRLTDIYKELVQLNKNITGLVSGLVRGFGTFSGEAFASEEAGWAVKTYEKIANLVDKFSFHILGFIDKLAGGLISKALGKVFGGKVTQKVTAAGVAIDPINVADILAGQEATVRAFFDIYKKKEGGIFGSTKRKRWTEYAEVDDDVTRLFTKIYGNISNMLTTLGKGFNVTADKMAEIFAYEFSEVKLDLKGLTGAEIAQRINEWIASVGDAAVEALFGDIVGKYQKIDEGLMETAIRLLTQKEILFSALEMLNMAFDKTGEGVIDFSQAIIALAEDFESLIDDISTYYDKFFTDAEKQEDIRKALEDAFAKLPYTEPHQKHPFTLPESREAFRDFLEGLDLSTEAGRELFVALMALAEMADKYYSYIEDHIDALLASIEDIKQAHKDFGKSTLDKIYEKFPEWKGMTYDEWADRDVTHWSEDMLEAWRDLGAELQRLWEEAQKDGEETEKVIEEVIYTLDDLIEALENNTEAIREYREELLGTEGVVSPETGYAYASKELDKAVKALWSGNLLQVNEALGTIPTLVGNFVEASRRVSSTPTAYNADMARALAVLNTAEKIGSIFATELKKMAKCMEIGEAAAWAKQGFYIWKGLPKRWLGKDQWEDEMYHMASGGVISGPEQGYTAPVEFHGTEHIIPGPQLTGVQSALCDINDVLVQVRDTNGAQHKVNLKLWRILDNVTQGEDFLRTQAVA